MATRNAQTQAKRARELALRDKRERKREKKEARRLGVADGTDGLGVELGAEETTAEPALTE